MAFWDDFDDESSALIKKLDDDSVSLQTIVGDPLCLMLIRDENVKIINYFAQPSIFRQLFHGALNSDVDPTMNETEQYRFAYQCSEVLCYPYDKLYNAYLEDEDTMNFLTSFLETEKDQMNHLVASFFAKIVLSLYNFDHSRILAALSKTQFIDTALDLMKFSSLSQLLINMASCIPLESRDKIKNYLIENDFGQKLCNAFKASTDFIALENIACLWSDFIKHIRDFCYTYDREDELMENLEHPDLIAQLLEHMFPEDVANRDSSAIVSGCLVLMAVLDRQYDSRLPSIDLHKGEEHVKLFNHDPEYVCETLCSKHIADLLITTLEAVKEDDGDIATRCMIVLEAIFNTSHPKNHEQFVMQLKMAQFECFFDFVKTNPTISLLNNSIHTLVSYMLHCSLAEEDHLVSYLFEDLGITSIILNALKEIPETGSSVHLYGARAFFNRLGERIIIAKEQSQNNARIMKHISELPDTLEWTDFADNKLQEYLQVHSTFDLSQTRTMSDVSSRIDFSTEDITDLEIDEWSTTLPPAEIEEPAASSNVNEEEEDDELALFRKLKPMSYDV